MGELTNNALFYLAPAQPPGILMETGGTDFVLQETGFEIELE